jgi:hypothetical protein
LTHPPPPPPTHHQQKSKRTSPRHITPTEKTMLDAVHQSDNKTKKVAMDDKKSDQSSPARKRTKITS